MLQDVLNELWGIGAADSTGPWRSVEAGPWRDLGAALWGVRLPASIALTSAGGNGGFLRWMTAWQFAQTGNKSFVGVYAVPLLDRSQGFR